MRHFCILGIATGDGLGYAVFMSATNQILLIGRLGSDPEIRHAGGNQVADVNLAVNRTQKGDDGKYITDWIPCTFWGKRAETLHTYCRKGDMISVVGSLQIQKWTTIDGQSRSKAVVQVDNFQMLGSPKGAQSSPEQRQQAQQYAKQVIDNHSRPDEDLPPF